MKVASCPYIKEYFEAKIDDMNQKISDNDHKRDFSCALNKEETTSQIALPLEDYCISETHNYLLTSEHFRKGQTATLIGPDMITMID